MTRRSLWRIPHIGRTERGDKRFWIIGTNGNRYEVIGNYYLSNLLQELKLAQDAGQSVALLDFRRIFESPVSRLSRLIRELYWNALTRRIDGQNLDQVFSDEKLVARDGFRYVYVPHSDSPAYQHFAKVSKDRPQLQMDVIRLPIEITPQYVKSLDEKPGILSLALKPTPNGVYTGIQFVVPGGRFNEMYGWDSYFIALGLLVDKRAELAKGMVDNFVYQITHYRKILNANRSYYLTRSQPPFLTSMALAVYNHLPNNAQSKAWLAVVFQAAIKEYHEVWMSDDRLTKIGLSRYYGSGIGPPPEVETGHFDAIYRPHATKRHMEIREFERLYQAGEIQEPKLDRFFIHDRAMRESGHDTTFRWDRNGDRCSDFVTVDLNSLLYKIELDIARTIQNEFGDSFQGVGGEDGKSTTWYSRAKKRKELINRYLWDDERGMFFDYDFINGQRHLYVSATGLYPLWACYNDDFETKLVTKKQAHRLVKAAIPQLEMPGGIVGSTRESRGHIDNSSRPARQWDYPNGWAPHQMLIWQGLMNYGFDDIAHRLIYRWLYTITQNAVDYNGTVTEKLDVVKRSHEVFAEYGNVGIKFAYITREGFGWTNASYQVGLTLLPDKLRFYLERIVPPEWLFEH